MTLPIKLTRDQMDAAKDLLKRAVELDNAQRYTESLICYEEGIQNLLRAMSTRSDAEKREMRKKAEEYLKRAEEVKKLVKDNEVPTEKVQVIYIKNGAVGYSYSNVFSKCLDGNLEWIEVEDPFIRARHQVHNFVRFCELVLKNCSKLKKIDLHTGAGEPDQTQHLRELRHSLSEHNVELSVEYLSTLHDREIRFSNGWIVRIGRGLDYFQRPKGQFTIGSNDYDFRPCHETTIEIYHRLNMKRLRALDWSK